MTDKDENTSREIEELLPYYVTGALDDNERAEVEAAAAVSAELRGAIEDLRILARSVRAAEAEMEEEIRSPGDLGLARLQKAIAEEDALERKDAVERHGIEPFRVKGPSTPILRRLAVAAALALAVGLGAGSFFTYQLDQRYLAAGSGEQHASAALLQVIFRPDARESEIRELLRREGLEIVAGPSALGIFRVSSGLESSKEREINALIARLEAEEAVVEQAALE